MTLRWGLLSTARINDAFIAGVRASAGGEVVAVASRDAERAADYARARAIPRAHGDYDALLADPDVDAVYVSLPNALHIEWTSRALRAGRHVLCEKPMSTDPDAVAAAFDLAAERGLVLAEAFMYRHHPQTRRLAQLVDDGAIGSLRAVRSHFTFTLGDPDDVRLQDGLGGGALMDLGCYCVNASRMLAGEPSEVGAVQTVGGGGVDVSFAGALRFADGVVADFDCGFTAFRGSGLEVVGETGSLRVADPWHARAPGISIDGPDGSRLEDVAAADAYGLEADDFAAAVAGEREPLLGRADAVGQAAALRGLYAAAASAVAL